MYTSATATEVVVSVRDLYTHFKTAEGIARAVDGVSFDIKQGETFAIVGESGCGKSVTAYSIMQLVQKPAGFHPHGEIILNSESIKNFDILKMNEKEKREMRGGEVAMIFQEPMTSLNPVFTIGHQISEAVVLHQNVSWKDAWNISIDMIHKVGIPDPEQRVKEYPHQLSGGMKQRAMIAMALSCKPSLLIADEPTTALDVTIQAQILSLMKELQEEMGMSILLITHDLGVVCEMADRVGVMYAGKIVEKASKEVLFSNPQHPYSLKLFQSLPDIDKKGQHLNVIKGFVPNATKFPDRCRFADRCDFMFHPCLDDTLEPRLLNIGVDDEHLVACHGFDENISDRPKIELKEIEAIFEKPTFEESPVILDVRNLKQYFPIKARKIFLKTKIKIFLGILNIFALATALYALLLDQNVTAITMGAACILSFGDVFLKTRKGGMLSIISYTLFLIFGVLFMINVAGIVFFPLVFFWFIMLMNLLMPGRLSLRAVDDVDLTIRKGHTMALVGESGCGKTTMGKSIIQLNKTTAGSVRYGGKELTNLKGESLKPFRQKMQIIFQDPYGSLNPRQMIGEIIEEGMLVHGVGKTKEEREAIIRDVLRHVNMAPEMMTRYPHEFSGGQRQRIGIARVLAIQPDFVVCDEPTSALDVSVQAQILNLLNKLQDEFDLTFLFITHDLRVVEFIADHVSVMYLGRIVEEGKTEEIFTNPKHPYTRALLTAIPETDPKSGFKKIKLEGDVPSPINPPRGCHFNPRCQYAMPICRAAYPGTTEETITHKVRCFLYGMGEIDIPEEVKWEGRKQLLDWDEERAKVRQIKEDAEDDRRSKIKNHKNKIQEEKDKKDNDVKDEHK